MSRARPWALEWLALVACGAVVALLRAHGLRVGWSAVEFTLPPMLSSLPRILAAGLLLQLVLEVAARRSARNYLRDFFRLDSIVSWLRICAAFMLVTFAYAWLKVCVPLVNPRSWDVELWRLDRLLHFGLAPNVFAVELVAGTPLVAVLDLWYSLWIVTIFVAWSWAAAHPEHTKRRNFVFACAFLSVAGSWGYLALPAVGPCFVYPELFDGIRGEIPHAVGTQTALAANYAKIVAGRDGTLRQFNPYLGVAALPSLHVGAHWLFALWARRHARRLFLPFAAMTALTFLGSIVTGWHYAIDGYAGMLLAWGAIRLADLVEPVASEEIGVAPPTSGELITPTP